MKVFYTMTAIFFLSIFAVSCSKEDDRVENQQNSDLSFENPNEFKGEGFNYYEATRKLDQQIGKNYPKLPLDQSTVNNYADLVGHDGEIEEGAANEIADALLYSKEVGMARVLDERTSFSKFTKSTLVKMSQAGPFENLEEIEEFNALPKAEKKLLLHANEIAASYMAGMGLSADSRQGCYINGEPAPCNVAGALGGAILGASIGTSLCGPVCGVGGAIIGGIIGWFAGDGK